MARGLFSIVVLGLLFLLLTAQGVQLTLANGGRLTGRNGWMLPVANPVLSSDEDDHLNRRSVDAWDLSTPYGAPIYPMKAGRVVYAGCNNAGGYGCWAYIAHDDGFNSLYGHMIDEGNGAILVQAGDQVSAWTVLGRVGWTGMTSFGPHTHWEIHRDNQGGRVRLDHYFERSAIRYCKFCAASGSESGGLGDVVWAQQQTPWNRLLQQPEILLELLLAIIVALALLRPEAATEFTKESSGFLLRLVFASGRSVVRIKRSRYWVGVNVLFVYVLPVFLLSSALALQIWMVDEGIDYQQVWMLSRFGGLPSLTSGYRSGAMYSAVWGAPCQQVGTLGRTCTVEGIVAKTIEWRDEVDRYTGKSTIPVAIPRINGTFGYNQARRLIQALHAVGGLTIVDVEGDLEMAEEAIDKLVDFGLDGIAIDLEFMDRVTDQDIRNLANYLGTRRQQAGLSSRGILVAWDVFHNLKRQGYRETSILGGLVASGNLSTNRVVVVPIFTGYGATTSKIHGMTTMQNLFEVNAEQSGLMAFDLRWPINYNCGNFGITQGYDCQRWQSLFSDPLARGVGWWVQQ